MNEFKKSIMPFRICKNLWNDYNTKGNNLFNPHFSLFHLYIVRINKIIETNKNTLKILRYYKTS